MKFLTRNQILALHRDLIDQYGGIHGLRDEGLLESALNAPFQTYGDQELFPSVIDKACRLCYGLVRNHPFLDGNKRIGTMAMLIYLDQNNISLTCTETDLTDEILKLASGSINNDDLAAWVLSYIE